jgi:hypothetical protein
MCNAPFAIVAKGALIGVFQRGHFQAVEALFRTVFYLPLLEHILDMTIVALYTCFSTKRKGQSKASKGCLDKRWHNATKRHFLKKWRFLKRTTYLN